MEYRPLVPKKQFQVGRENHKIEKYRLRCQFFGAENVTIFQIQVLIVFDFSLLASHDGILT